MTATSAALAGQALAESLMTDVCTITRTIGRTFDETTNTYTPTTTPVYSGKCRVKPANTVSRDVQAGEQQVSLWPFAVSIPVSVTTELDDDVTVTASADASLVGRTLRVRSVARGTYLTARRLDCEEAS